MKFIDDIRRERLAVLAKSVGGVAALADILGRTDSQVSQWITGAKLPSGRRRGMKSETARWIEKTTGQPPGYLDTPTMTETPVDTPHVGQPIGTYAAKPHHERALVQTVCELAEQVNDDGLRELIGFARCLTGTHPLIKQKRRSSA